MPVMVTGESKAKATPPEVMLLHRSIPNEAPEPMSRPVMPKTRDVQSTLVSCTSHRLKEDISTPFTTSTNEPTIAVHFRTKNELLVSSETTCATVTAVCGIDIQVDTIVCWLESERYIPDE